MTRIAALIVAAGRGVRAGNGGPKQYRMLGGAPVIRRTLASFAGHPQIDTVQAVIHPDDAAEFAAATAGLTQQPPVAGGVTRQASVLAGLEALVALKPGIVLIHDAARPFIDDGLISRAIAAATTGAAIPVVVVSDTVKAVNAQGLVTATPDRATLRLAQTPQVFAFDAILAAHRKAAQSGRDDFTDDAALAAWAGLTVATFEGDAGNMKLTTADDFATAEQRLANALLDVRTDTGYDVHAFGPGDHVMLCGVRIAHDMGVVAHSDGDVALHALTDAILGALADGDIGTHFPPSDPRWKGASSDRFLADAAARVTKRGGRIAHLDVAIVCEAPKVGPHRDAMRARIAQIAGIEIGRVSVKATTSERLGFTGRREGLAAMATATLHLPLDRSGV
jgi:2-C-methyl-D-erythritol 4-phosphate cytidylyltransferase/2-C-methyl-D-erythritol 2,4-cyclodiphosphate synthase